MASATLVRELPVYGVARREPSAFTFNVAPADIVPADGRWLLYLPEACVLAELLRDAFAAHRACPRPSHPPRGWSAWLTATPARRTHIAYCLDVRA